MEILDASALIAFIKKEPGGEKIEKILSKAEQKMESVFIHQINYIEFLYKCYKLYEIQKVNHIIADLESPYLGVINYFDAQLGFYSSYLKSHYTLSLGDAIGLAYTKTVNGCFYTADRALEPIAKKEKIKLSLIRS